MINFGKPRRVFIDIGIGYSFGGIYDEYFEDNKKFSTIDGAIGIGYRFGDLN